MVAEEGEIASMLLRRRFEEVVAVPEYCVECLREDVAHGSAAVGWRTRKDPKQPM